jgi:hypothetical protein
MVNDERHLEAIDRDLARLFAADEGVPSDFTLCVIRRIQNQRWKREVFLGRVLYGGLCASGILIIAGLGVAFGTVTTLAADTAVKIALIGLSVGGIATWPHLTRASFN